MNSTTTQPTLTAKSINTPIPWYKRNSAIITLLIIYWPCGIYLMWKHGKWSNKVKWSVTGAFTIMCVIGLANHQETATSIKSNTQENIPTSVEPSSAATEETDRRFLTAIESSVSQEAKGALNHIPDSQKITAGKSVCQSFSQDVTFEDFSTLILQKYGNSSSNIELGGALIGAAVSVYCPEYSYKLP